MTRCQAIPCVLLDVGPVCRRVNLEASPGRLCSLGGRRSNPFLAESAHWVAAMTAFSSSRLERALRTLRNGLPGQRHFGVRRRLRSSSSSEIHSIFGAVIRALNFEVCWCYR